VYASGTVDGGLKLPIRWLLTQHKHYHYFGSIFLSTQIGGLPIKMGAGVNSMSKKKPKKLNILKKGNQKVKPKWKTISFSQLEVLMVNSALKSAK
jgi:hypothetical protein